MGAYESFITFRDNTVRVLRADLEKKKLIVVKHRIGLEGG